MSDLPLTLDDGVFGLRLHRAPEATSGVYEAVDAGDHVVTITTQESPVTLLRVENIPRFIEDMTQHDEYSSTKTIGKRYTAHIGTDGPTRDVLEHTYGFPRSVEAFKDILQRKDCAVCGAPVQHSGVAVVHRTIIHAECTSRIEPIFDDVWEHTDTMLSNKL